MDGGGRRRHALPGGEGPAGAARRLVLGGRHIVSLVAAAAILFLPGLSAFALVLVAGAWSAAVGVSRLIMAFRVGNVLLGLLGAVAVVAGVWLILAPGPGLLALIWLVGLEALIVGGLLIGLGWRLRRIHHDPHGPAAAATAPGPV